MGLHPDGGWMPASLYTPTFSAVIKIMRFLLVHQAALEDEEEEAELRRQGHDDDYIDEHAQGLVERVREKVFRYMVSSTIRTPSTPIAWIYDAKAYGMTI